jgi:hypothetical protein
MGVPIILIWVSIGSESCGSMMTADTRCVLLTGGLYTFSVLWFVDYIGYARRVSRVKMNNAP